MLEAGAVLVTKVVDTGGMTAEVVGVFGVVGAAVDVGACLLVCEVVSATVSVVLEVTGTVEVAVTSVVTAVVAVVTPVALELVPSCLFANSINCFATSAFSR